MKLIKALLYGIGCIGCAGIGITFWFFSMETQPLGGHPGAHIAPLRGKAAAKVPFGQMLDVLWNKNAGPDMQRDLAASLAKKLLMPHVLNEFMNSGTIEGVNLEKDIVPEEMKLFVNSWAYSNLPNALMHRAPWTENLLYLYKNSKVYPFEQGVGVVAMNPDGEKMVIVSGGIVQVGEQNEQGDWIFKPLEGVSDNAKVVFSSDGSMIEVDSVADTVRVRIWGKNVAGEWESQVLRGMDDSVVGMGFSPDGTKIVVALNNNRVRVFEKNAAGEWVLQEVRGHDGGVVRALFSPDGTKILLVLGDSRVIVVEKNAEGEWQWHELRGENDIVVLSEFSPDSTKIVISLRDRTARVWEKNAAGEWELQQLIGHDGVVTAASFSPDGTKIVTAANNRTIRIWGKNTAGEWKSQELIGHNNPITSILFSPDGNKMVTMSVFANNAHAWVKNARGEWVSDELASQAGAPNSVVFSPDGTKIMTFAFDEKIRVWLHNDEGVWKAQELTGHRSIVNSAFFNDNGRKITSASRDSTIRVWEQIDLIGEQNVIAKIALLLLLDRYGKDVLIQQDGNTVSYPHSHLLRVFATFDDQAKEYLTKKYDLSTLSSAMTAVMP